MAEMEMDQIEVCLPRPISIRVWRGFVSWVAFFLQFFLQILRGTPSFFSYIVGLSSSSYRSLLASSSPSFKRLPIDELPLQESSVAATPDVTVHDGVGDDGGGGGDEKEMEKLTVVLDLDQTLVCAYETSRLPAIIHTQATEAGLKWFELECVSSDKECDGKPKINVTVFQRPELHEFLKKLAEFAGSDLFIKRSLPSCIVDNNPFSFLLQPMNGIPCFPFSTIQPYDNQLLEVIRPLLKHLLLQKDVRPVLYERLLHA